MNQEIMLKLERASRDRDFFILNKDAIGESYLFLEDVLSKYIDICCMKFKSFKVNKTSYIYGCIFTLAAAFVVSCEKHFANARGNAMEYLCRDIFPLFIEEYNSTTLVTDKTQSHMLKGCVEEYVNIKKKLTKYCSIGFDKYFDNNLPEFIKHYLNQILKYCVEHKADGSSADDVATELMPLLSKIF